MIDAAVIILALVTAQRLIELVLARRNTDRLIAAGAIETGRSHYPLIVLLHAAWLAALWWLAPGQPVSWLLVGLFALLQLARVWVIASLRRRWTTRIITLPGEERVRSGPYRFVDHPNYLIVALEIALLPLAFGLVRVALVFSVLNAAMLAVRIRAENRALRASS